MSILITGMEMPPSCRYCEFRHLSLTQNAFCTASHETIDYMAERTKRLDNCPLVELPPHGRLVDADAFAAEMKKRQEEAEKWLREAKDRETAVRADAVLSFLCEVKLTLDAAPTIIEAEGEE